MRGDGNGDDEDDDGEGRGDGDGDEILVQEGQTSEASSGSYYHQKPFRSSEPFQHEVGEILSKAEEGGVPSPRKSTEAEEHKFHAAYHYEHNMKVDEGNDEVENDVRAQKHEAPGGRWGGGDDSWVDGDQLLPCRRLRVGFLSAFYFHHSVGLLTQGVITRLDRRRFETTAIFFQPHSKDASGWAPGTTSPGGASGDDVYRNVRGRSEHVLDIPLSRYVVRLECPPCWWKEYTKGGFPVMLIRSCSCCRVNQINGT